MQKLAKRTLAFLLVVSMLCGMMVMTASAITATPESDGSYYYDFTQTATLKWQSHDSDAKLLKQFKGWGQRNLFGITKPQRDILEVYYNKGGYTETIEDCDHAGVYEFEGQLDWLPLAKSNNEVQLVCGGNSSTVPEETHQGYNGVQFISWGDAKVRKVNEWAAIQIKAPTVGRYNVTLNYTMGNNGAKRGALYLLPGEATAEEINAAIANNEGKMGVVDFKGTLTKWSTGHSIELNDFVCNTPAESYTLVLHSETNSAGTRADGTEARMFIDGLRLTPNANAAETFVYDFNLYSQGLTGSLSDNVENINNLYAKNHWDLLENTATTAATVNASGYIYFQTVSAGKYVALKLKSPGEGRYQLDMTAFVAAYKSDYKENDVVVYTADMIAHLWLNAYLVKLDNTKTTAQQWADAKAAGATGEYKPDYKTRTSTGFETASLLTAEFEEGAEYILFLARHQDADFSNKPTDSEDRVRTYSPNNMYPGSITAKKVLTPKDIAAIGEEYIAPDSKTYSFAKNTGNTTVSTLYGSCAGKYTDGSETGMDAEGNVTGYVIGVHGDAVDFSIDGKDYNILNSTPYLQYYNTDSKPYYYHYNAATNVYTLAPNSTLVTNMPLKTGLAAKYEEFGWEVIGMSNANGVLFDNNFMQFYTVSNNNYVALKLRSPGEGEFEVDLQLYNYPTANINSHMGLKVYIVEAKDAVYSVNADMKLTGVTLPETPNAQYIPIYDEATTSKINDAALIKYGTENESFTYDFKADTEYVIYLQRDSKTTSRESSTTDTNGNGKLEYSPDNIYLSSIVAKPTRESDYADRYTSLDEAMDASAASGEVVRLIDDVMQTEVNIPAGAILDLNGYKLTTSNFTTFEGGKIIDSVGTGLLNVLADDVTFEGDNPLAENTLPIYDAANTGYRFFEYSYSVWGADDDAQYKDREEGGVEGAVRFWYQLNFADAKAYELIAAGNSGVQLGIDVNLNGEVIQECTFKHADESESTWMQDWASLKADGEAKWLWVRIQDAAGVEGLSITPVISAGGLNDIKLAEIPSVQQ